MANSYASGVYTVTEAGIVRERSDKTAIEPITVRAFLMTGTGTATIKDNQATAATLFTISAAGNASLSFGSKGFQFPHGLQITTITGGTLYVFVG